MLVELDRGPLGDADVAELARAVRPQGIGRDERDDPVGGQGVPIEGGQIGVTEARGQLGRGGEEGVLRGHLVGGALRVLQRGCDAVAEVRHRGVAVAARRGRGARRRTHHRILDGEHPVRATLGEPGLEERNQLANGVAVRPGRIGLAVGGHRLLRVV